jgi:hypothetical protein
MLAKDVSVVSLMGALVFSGILGSSGMDTHRAMTEKAQAQVSAVQELREWKRQYEHLIPVEERWNASLGLFSEAKDLLTIHGLVSVKAPHTNPDTLLVGSISRLVLNEQDLGAQKVCVTSNGSGMLFTEKTFSELIFGLQDLSSRVDLEVGTVHLSQEKGKAKAMVSPVCLLLRDTPVVGAPL